MYVSLPILYIAASVLFCAGVVIGAVLSVARTADADTDAGDIRRVDGTQF